MATPPARFDRDDDDYAGARAQRGMVDERAPAAACAAKKRKRPDTRPVFSIYRELWHLYSVQATSGSSVDKRWLRSRPIVACRLMRFHRRFAESLALTVRVYQIDAARIRFGVFHPCLSSAFVFEVQEENDDVELVSSIRMKDGAG